MTLEVVFAPEARDDLAGIYDFIADRSYPDRAYGGRNLEGMFAID